MLIGEKIRKAREKKNYTQEFVAKKSGMSTTGYGDIERGKTDVSWSRIVSITRALGITIQEIICDKTISSLIFCELSFPAIFI